MTLAEQAASIKVVKSMRLALSPGDSTRGRVKSPGLDALMAKAHEAAPGSSPTQGFGKPDTTDRLGQREPEATNVAERGGHSNFALGSSPSEMDGRVNCGHNDLIVLMMFSYRRFAPIHRILRCPFVQRSSWP